MFAITVFPKRLGLVIQICEFPVSAGKNNSSSIKLLSTKYGFLTSLSYKEYGAALFKKFPFSASSVFFILLSVYHGKLLFTRKTGDISPAFCCKVTVHGIPISKTGITKVALLLSKASESSAKMIL